MRESAGFFHPPAGHRPPRLSRRCRFLTAQGPDPNFQSHFTWPGPLNGCIAVCVCWGSWSKGAEPALAKPTLRFRADRCCLTQHNCFSPWTAGEGKRSLRVWKFACSPRRELKSTKGQGAFNYQILQTLEVEQESSLKQKISWDYCFLRRRGGWEDHGAKEWE